MGMGFKILLNAHCIQEFQGDNFWLAFRNPPLWELLSGILSKDQAYNDIFRHYLNPSQTPMI